MFKLATKSVLRPLTLQTAARPFSEVKEGVVKMIVDPWENSIENINKHMKIDVNDMKSDIREDDGEL